MMKSNELEESKKRIAQYAKLVKTIMDRELSETTMRQILDILKNTRTLENEQRYQLIMDITDIINKSKTEEEIVAKLNKEYPLPNSTK